MTNDEIVAKYRSLTAGVMARSRASEIERLVLGLPDIDDIAALTDLLAGTVERILDR